QVVPALETGLSETRSAFDGVSDKIVSSLDGLRAHLTASGGFTTQAERLRELRAAIDGLATGLQDAVAPPASATETGAAITALRSTVDGLLARIEERNREAGTRNATLETMVAASARQLEEQVKSVLGGIGSNERLVRGRFDELGAAIRDIRGELSQVRSLRAEVDELGAGLDTLRSRVAREQPVQG
ncbi:MAG: hypothetical protein JWP02_1806, partial [Acidimicrobiales bacterium]|nr:hypothetical protein [Acidimicrobiales bacterium]